MSAISFGNEEAIHIGSRFYKELVTQHDFSPRPVLEGMSRGGLFCLQLGTSESR